MRKITYNLATDRRVNGRGFAARAAALVLAALVLGGMAMQNWTRQRAQDLVAASATGATAQRLQEMKSESSRLKRQLGAWKKSLGAELREANARIRRKGFSFLSRLDFLENKFSPGIRVRHLALANEESSRMTMTITAQSLKELFALYKKLAPYGLVIASETQSREEYQVKMHVQVTNEQI
jgi:hypothetical protein